ncbi:proline-rich protein 36-like [Penaeus chinensis]|uniref:proline-rich protein 36-like n=1 Tax=Penaeus chinensis TaxID=139456 RepID=UPI001FB7B4C9|nr:proline-rich protein 36-like [Penaeus chinensis]
MHAFPPKVNQSVSRQYYTMQLGSREDVPSAKMGCTGSVLGVSDEFETHPSTTRMPSNTFPGHDREVDPATTDPGDAKNDGDAVSTISNGKIGALNEGSGTQMTLLNDALGGKQDNRPPSARSSKSRTPSRTSSSAKSRSSRSSKSAGSTRPASATDLHTKLPGSISEDEKEEEKPKEEAKPEVKDFSKEPLKKAEDMIIKPTVLAAPESAENEGVTDPNDKNKETADRVASAKSTKSRNSAKNPLETLPGNEEAKTEDIITTENGKQETDGPAPPTENEEPKPDEIKSAVNDDPETGTSGTDIEAKNEDVKSEVSSEAAPEPEADTLETIVEDTVKRGEEIGMPQADTSAGEGTASQEIGVTPSTVADDSLDNRSSGYATTPATIPTAPVTANPAMVTTSISGYYAPSYMPSARPTTGVSESKYMASLPAQLMASVGSNASSIGFRAPTGMNSNVASRYVAPIMVPNMARGSMTPGVFLNMAYPRPVVASPSPTMAPGLVAPHSLAQVMVPRPMAAGGMVGVPGTIPYVLPYLVPVPAYNNSEINRTVATPGPSSVRTGSHQPFVLRPLGQQGRPFGVRDHD